jgi:hypothetical protein
LIEYFKQRTHICVPTYRIISHRNLNTTDNIKREYICMYVRIAIDGLPLGCDSILRTGQFTKNRRRKYETDFDWFNIK